MKALVQIAFAIEVIDEDGLAEMARGIDEGMRKSIAENFTPEGAEATKALEDRDLVDWYGVTISLRKPVFEGVDLG